MKSQSEYIENIFDSIKLILKEHKPKKIFLITGKNSFEISGAKNKITKTLKNYETIIFNDFDVNPKIEDIYKNKDMLTLSSHGTIIILGSFLIPEERRVLAKTIRSGLNDWKNQHSV